MFACGRKFCLVGGYFLYGDIFGGMLKGRGGLLLTEIFTWCRGFLMAEIFTWGRDLLFADT